MKTLPFLLTFAVSCGSEPCRVVDTPNGALIDCPGRSVEVLDGRDGADGLDGRDGVDGADGKAGANGADGRDGADGADGETLRVRRVYACDIPQEPWADETKRTWAYPGPVFYDVGTFWMVTCGARVAYDMGDEDEYLDTPRAFLAPPVVEETAAVECFAAGLLISLQPSAAAVTFSYEDQPENDVRQVCDCYGDC